MLSIVNATCNTKEPLWWSTAGLWNGGGEETIMPSPPPVTPEPQFIKCVHARLSDSYLQLVPLCCFPLSPGGLLLVSIWRQAVEWAPLFLGPVLQRMQLGKVRRGGLACYSGGEGTDDKAQRHLTIVLWYFVKSSLFFPLLCFWMLVTVVFVNAWTVGVFVIHIGLPCVSNMK